MAININLSYPNDNIVRKYNENLPEYYRSGFARDRDRVLYSKEFRRLNGKTQVFVSGFDDHVRNRLTHTLEVNQIALTLGGALNLNLDLIEAITLAHDVGHTPFGHVGERYLNQLMNGCFDYARINYEISDDLIGFKHNMQGARVVSELEKISSKFTGINLSNQTICGVIHHTSAPNKRDCEYAYKTDNGFKCRLNNKDELCFKNGSVKFGYYSRFISEYTEYSLEARVVALSDEIAQRHHDIEDAIEAKIINKKDLFDKLLKLQLIDYKESVQLGNEINKEVLLHDISKIIISKYINDIIKQTESNLAKYTSKSQLDLFEELARSIHEKLYVNLPIKDKMSIAKSLIDMSPTFTKMDKSLQDYLKNVILKSNTAQKMDGKSQFMLGQIVKSYIDNPQQLPLKTIFSVLQNYVEIVQQHEEVDTYKKLDALKSFVKNFKFDPASNELNSSLRDYLTELNMKNSVLYKISLLRTITDYLSGMTDNFAIGLYESLYGFSRKHQ